MKNTLTIAATFACILGVFANPTRAVEGKPNVVLILPPSTCETIPVSGAFPGVRWAVQSDTVKKSIPSKETNKRDTLEAIRT